MSDALKDQVLQILTGIAPEVEPGQIEPDTPWREQLDVDSVDMLNFILALHKQLKVEIPEADYAKIDTLNRMLAYLEKARKGARP